MMLVAAYLGLWLAENPSCDVLEQLVTEGDIAELSGIGQPSFDEGRVLHLLAIRNRRQADAL